MMREQRTFFGVNKKLIERLESLDETWFVEIWLVKYYFIGIEIFSKKKEIVKHNQAKAKCSS